MKSIPLKINPGYGPVDVANWVADCIPGSAEVYERSKSTRTRIFTFFSPNYILWIAIKYNTRTCAYVMTYRYKHELPVVLAVVQLVEAMQQFWPDVKEFEQANRFTNATAFPQRRTQNR
jgi:hypothetical protein